jgi:hypothetical protein
MASNSYESIAIGTAAMILDIRSVSQGKEDQKTEREDLSTSEKCLASGSVFVAEVPATVEVFFPWHVDVGPVGGTDADDTGGADAFGDEVRFKTDLDAAAAQGGVSGGLRDVEDGAS